LGVCRAPLETSSHAHPFLLERRHACENRLAVADAARELRLYPMGPAMVPLCGCPRAPPPTWPSRFPGFNVRRKKGDEWMSSDDWAEGPRPSFF
jgi:hypothetical protein